MSEALVIIDIQNDYFPGGRMEVVNAEKAARNAQSLLNAFRNRNKMIIHVWHLSQREGATFFLPGTKGIEIHESVRPAAAEKVIVKHFPNSFRDTALADFLHENGIKNITFCGMMTLMCIDATVRAAYDLGFACTVAEDACATRDLSHGRIDVSSAKVNAAFMAALAGVYAKVVSSSEIIQQLGA